jgi:1-phosphofructokinase family hexose kinase
MIYTVSTNPALDLILTVPAIDFDVVLRAHTVRRALGGKGFNVSRYLQALGMDSVAVAFAGGFTGQALAAGLRAGGIATDFIPLEEETRTNVVVAEPSGRHIKANQAGATIPPAGKQAFWDLLRRRAQPGDLWVLTGSLAPGLEEDFYAEVGTELRRRGAAFVLDTSGGALRRGCAAGPRLVKPNVVEAEEFTGRTIDSPAAAAAAAGAFLAAGAELVILSLGKDGAIVAGEGALLHLQGPPVTVKTAVGAGDAVVAGAVYALRGGLGVAEIGVAEIGRWGVATATVTAMHDDLAAHHRAAVADLLPQVTVRSLA